MSKRSSYKKYYDPRYCDKPIPKSTKCNRKKRKSQLSSKQVISEENESQYVMENTSNAEDNAVSNDNTPVCLPESSKLNEGYCEQHAETLNKNVTNNIFHERLRERICDCSNTNIGEILLMGMKIAVKHSLTWVALLDIFHVFNCIFNKSILPTTKYMLRNLLQVKTDSLTYHLLCLNCKKYLGTKSNLKKTVVCTCGVPVNTSSVGSFFIELNIKDQLRKLFSDEKVVESLSHRFHRSKNNENGLEDLYDGNVYKRYTENTTLLRHNFNFSYTCNTDGCQAADSSKVLVWPIYIMLHELPDDMRKKHMILAGLWVAKTEPDMNIHLQPIVNQANNLSSNGFEWQWKDKIIISKFFPLGCCVDSVARCAMLCMKKYNGKYGCTYCEHPTEAVDGVRKYPMQPTIPTERTDQSIKEKMILAHVTEENDLTGVRGPSSLMNLNHFDLVDGMVLDFMHSCLLGVTQLLTSIILSNSKEKYYVGSPDKLHLIDKRLQAIRPPTCVAKVARSIKERNMWKASEWLSWLICYSLICLRGVLKKKYYENLAMFVTAMSIFLEDSVTPDMIERARQLLIKFVINFERLYGKKYMHYNVHLLLHLCKTVTNWGPLYSVNTFPFENQNKLLLNMKKCNYRVAQQITYRLLIYQQLPLLQNSTVISDRVKQICDSFYDKRLKYFCKVGDCVLIGNGKPYSLSREEINCLERVMDVNAIRQCTKFCKIIYGSYRYTTSAYFRSKRRNDSIIQTRNNKYGIISNICKITHNNVSNVIIFFKELTIGSNLIINNIEVSHFKHLDTQQQLILNVTEYSMLRRPCIVAHSKANEYILLILVKGMLGRHCN